MTPEIDEAFENIKREYGARSIERVERMLHPRNERHPAQAGAKWIMPGLSQRAWHDPHAYPQIAAVVTALESQHADIKAEFKAAFEDRTAQIGNYEHYLVKRDDWKALYLFRKGELVRESASLTPATFDIIDREAVRTSKLCPLLESHFSTLLPGTTIPPHCDLWNFSINLHFAVDIPPGCAIKVAGEERRWVEGKCLLFDYSFLHEAWNKGDRPRTCLLVDLWHPEVTLPERQALTVLITEVRKLLG
ncbi:MAG TPA: aspartyl/asparaginyl beta-hydroxylase domain-containing protein [Labilithrix sp.]|nr:aspartyl/asparaginyl beta-hydroxylase domain-containing protein [Labilithrix sp.]